MTVFHAVTSNPVGRNSSDTESGDEQGSIFRLQLYAVSIEINAGAAQTAFPAAIVHNQRDRRSLLEANERLWLVVERPKRADRFRQHLIRTAQ